MHQIRFRPGLCPGPRWGSLQRSELIKLIFAILDVSLTMGLTRCYKTEVFLHLYLQFLYLRIFIFAVSLIQTP